MAETAVAPIESFALTTQRGNSKLKYAGRLFRLQRKIPNSNNDGTKSYYYKCCTSQCTGRLIGYCSVDEDTISEFQALFCKGLKTFDQYF